MARQNSQQTVSLFPFLAVLVCTMGALILLLLVTTRRIRQDLQNTESAVVSEGSDDAPLFETLDSQVADQDEFSKVPASEETEENFVNVPEDSRPAGSTGESVEMSIHLEAPEELTVSEARATSRERRARVEELRGLLESAQARFRKLEQEIENARRQVNDTDADGYQTQMDQLTELRLQQAELREDLAGKKELLAGLQAELDLKSETTEDAESLLRQRESDLVSLREIVKQAESATGTDATFLDFTNSTGTQRSPIVIDVTEHGFEFLPSSVKVTIEDMKGFPANDNPLLSGVVAIHEHRFPDSVTVKPYVLLLVRPGGSLQFYAVQRTLTEAGIHFGYELIEQGRRVTAGTIAADETEALRSSVLGALQRREQLYRGMLAEAQLSEQSLPRKMRVMPDGRILSADDEVEGYDGRFYAGGEAPPPALPGQTIRRPSKNPVSPKKQFRADDPPLVQSPSANERNAADPWADGEWDREIEKRSAGNARRVTPETASTEDLDSLTEPNFADAGPTPDAGDFDIPVIIPQSSDEGDQKDTSESTDTERKFMVDTLFERDNADAAATDPTQILGRSETISGNLGVRGGSGTRTPSGLPDGDSTEDLFTQAISERAGEGAIDRPAAMPDSPESRDVSNNREADRTDSLERFDWPELATADANQGTRTVEPPENPIAASAGNFGLGPESDDDAQGVPPSDVTSQLLLLKQRNAGSSAPAFPNPLLGTMLRTAKANDPGLAGYHPIKVHIGLNSLKVGRLETIDIKGTPPDEVFQLTLDALADEVQLLPEDQQEGTVPTIDYVVGAGAGRMQRRLENALQRMDVPTRTVINVGRLSPSESPQEDLQKKRQAAKLSDTNDADDHRRRLSI